MRNNKGFSTVELLPVLLLVVGVIGWIINIVKLISHGTFDFEGVLRAIGIFVAPLGVFFGLFWW